ncbi:hypothetical protein [Streptomyces sp. NPDC048825]
MATHFRAALRSRVGHLPMEDDDRLSMKESDRIPRNPPGADNPR